MSSYVYSFEFFVGDTSIPLSGESAVNHLPGKNHRSLQEFKNKQFAAHRKTGTQSTMTYCSLIGKIYIFKVSQPRSRILMDFVYFLWSCWNEVLPHTHKKQKHKFPPPKNSHRILTQFPIGQPSWDDVHPYITWKLPPRAAQFAMFVVVSGGHDDFDPYNLEFRSHIKPWSCFKIVQTLNDFI